MDQAAGDELVQAVLFEIGQDATAFISRVSGFRLFILKWREIIADDDTPLFSGRALVKGLGAPPDDERLVLLLVDVLQFSPADADEILQPVSAPVGDLLQQARSKLEDAFEKPRRAVIIEDEPLIAADLSDILASLGVEVAGTAPDSERGAALAKNEKPDIILADYNLDGERTGVDAVLNVQLTHSCPVIFITGYPDEVLSGKRVEPDFVIIKPYTVEAIRASVAHCLETDRYESAEWFDA